MKLAVFPLLLLVFVAPFFGCNSATTAQKEDTHKIRMRFPEGKYEMEVVSNSDVSTTLGQLNIQAKEDQTHLYELTAARPESNGTQILTMKWTRWKSRQETGNQVTEVDTADGKPLTGRMENKTLLLGINLKITVDANGKIVKTEGFNEHIDALIEKYPAKKDMLQMSKSLIKDEMFSRVFAIASEILPEHEISPGATWELECSPDIPSVGRPVNKLKISGKLENIDTSGITPIAEISSNFSLQSQEPMEFESSILKPKYKNIDIKSKSTMRLEPDTGLLRTFENSVDLQLDLCGRTGESISTSSGISKIGITVTPLK